MYHLIAILVILFYWCYTFSFGIGAADQTRQYVLEFIESNADNMVGLHVAKEHLGLFSAGEIEEIMSVMSPNILKTKAGEAFVEAAVSIKQSAIGSHFVDMTFSDPQGNTVALSDYLGKGNYVLLNFWASWCGPCIADLPHKMEAYELYYPEGFRVISISMDANKEAWLKKIEEFHVPWPQMSDLNAFDGEVSKVYNFSGIPTNLLIDPQGMIVSRNMRGS